MFFNTSMKLTVIIAGLALAVPASALTNVGDKLTIPGFVSTVSGTAIPGLTGSLELEVLGKSGKDWTLGYTIKNLADASKFESARISAFGFNTEPDIDKTFYLSGPYTTLTSGNVPEGFGKVEFCGSAGPNCAGGAGGGTTLGDTSTGSFTLRLESLANSLVISNQYIRWQSLDSKHYDFVGESGVGTPGAVPEPASWAMLIVGFGAVGTIARRRRSGVAVAA